MYWGTLGFVLIEGTTLVVLLVSYFYLRRNFDQWPPPGTPLPSLAIGTLAVLGVLASLVPANRAMRAAERMDRAGTRRWALAHMAAGLLLLALRGVELAGLGTRWDDHAYGSITWLLLGMHTTVVLTDVADSVFIAFVFLLRKDENKHYPSVADNSGYWDFVVASWAVIYVVIYLAPRWT